MKNLYKLAAVASVAAMLAPVTAFSQVTMCAGQSMDVGDITVTNDDDNLYVSFEVLEPGWYLSETHVAVGATKDDLPTNKSGNPVPGQFPYACELNGSLQTQCEVTVPIGDLPLDVVVAAHAAVFQLQGEGCGTDIQYANEVVVNNQGTLKNGGAVLAQRSVESAVFQGDDVDVGDDLNTGFFSLGFDGDIMVSFGDYPVYNAPGIDLCIQEVTNNRATYPEEFVDIYAVNEVETIVDQVSNRVNGTGMGCVDLPADMQTADFIKLDDVTNPAAHIATADAYDVDWVGACYLYMGDETAWGAACPDDDGQRFVTKGNWGTYFEYRIVPENCAYVTNADAEYLICQGQNTVSESEAFCADEEMGLAYIDDLAENTFVVDAALAEFGYVNFEQTSYWIANTKTDSPIFPWASPEPNSLADQCIHILRYDQEPYGWNDAGCENWTWGWVCESVD